MSRMSMRPRIWLPLPYTVSGSPAHCLDDQAVEHRAEHRVVVETRREPVVERGVRGLLAVDDALVEVGRAQPQMRQANSMLWLSCTFDRW